MAWNHIASSGPGGWDNPPLRFATQGRPPPISLDQPMGASTVEGLAGRIRELAADRAGLTFYLGRQPYRPVWDLQRRLHAWRVAGEIPDVVLMLEHTPVYTLGKNASPANLLKTRPADPEVVLSDRGGDVTYHGPGQLVGYPIINLKDHRPSVTWYLRGLEGVIIETLSTFGIRGESVPGLTGVWVDGHKIAALGVRLARWTSMHGFAINVEVPRRYFDGIVPCGIANCRVVNMNDYLQVPTTVPALARRIGPCLRRLFLPAHAENLAEVVTGPPTLQSQTT